MNTLGCQGKYPWRTQQRALSSAWPGWVQLISYVCCPCSSRAVQPYARYLAVIFPVSHFPVFSLWYLQTSVVSGESEDSSRSFYNVVTLFSPTWLYVGLDRRKVLVISNKTSGVQLRDKTGENERQMKRSAQWFSNVFFFQVADPMKLMMICYGGCHF